MKVSLLCGRVSWMDRKGQTWCCHRLGVVFTVLRSRKPTTERQFWIHNVLFLEDRRSPKLVGTKQELEEAKGRAFEASLKRIA